MAADKSPPAATIAARARVAVYVDLDLVGDALIKLPFLRALRHAYPAAEITWIAGCGKSAFAGALAPLAAGLLDRVLENAGTGANLATALGGRLDLLIDTQGMLGTALALRRLKPRRFVTEAAWGLPGWPPRCVPRPPRHLATRLLASLSYVIGAEPRPDAPLLLPAQATALAERLLPDGQRYVAQVLGAGGKHKAWPEAMHVDLARRLMDGGITPVLILGPDEADRHADLAAALPGALFPLQAATALGDTAAPDLTIALARRCLAAVAADCGGGHMMAAAGIPLISLFGPTDPQKFAPAAARLALLRAEDFGGRETAAIPVAAVFDALVQSFG